MKKILLTGSCGFIGANFLRQALFCSRSNIDGKEIPIQPQYNFASIDDCRGHNALNNHYTSRGHQLHIGNITDQHFIDVVFELERPDIVIHLLDQKSGQANQIVQTNITGTQTLIEAANKWNVERFIYLSDYSVYSPQLNKLVEVAPTNPKSVYGVTKFSSEMLLKNSSLANTILRIGTIYGQRQSIDEFVPICARALLQGEEFICDKKSSSTQEWTHVDDIVSAIMLAIVCDCGVYNVSSGNEFSYLEIAKQIAEILSSDLKLVQFIGTEEVSTAQLNSDKIESQGWKPRIRMRQGIGQVAKWLQLNQWQFR